MEHHCFKLTQLFRPNHESAFVLMLNTKIFLKIFKILKILNLISDPVHLFVDLVSSGTLEHCDEDNQDLYVSFISSENIRFKMLYFHIQSDILASNKQDAETRND